MPPLPSLTGSARWSAWGSKPRGLTRVAGEGGIEDAATDRRLVRLKWLAIILPLAFLSLVHYLLHTVLEVLHNWPTILLLFVWVAVGIAVLAFGVFRVIGILERRILEQNRQLSTVNEIVAASARNLMPEELVEVALDKVLEAMRVEAGLICVLDTETTELIAARRRGFSEELAGWIQNHYLSARGTTAAATGSNASRPAAAAEPPRADDLLCSVTPRLLPSTQSIALMS